MTGAGVDLVRSSYAAFTDAVSSVDEPASWQPTGCRGWAVRDLVFHVLGDAQRALVALHTPTGADPDRDAVSYWADWPADPVAAAAGRRHARVSASMFADWEQLRGLFGETAGAVVEAARRADPAATVRTQGHVLRVDDLLRTLAVEATIHHLDLTTHLPGGTGLSGSGLAEVRRVLDGLLGRQVAAAWPDERYALVATGRATATPAEVADLAELAGRLPVLS